MSCIGEARPGAALTEDAIFRIASMTKPITSIAFMMLVEEGKVALSTPLVKICPEFADTGVFVAGGGNVPFLTRPPMQPIRMVDLLRHTSGLTYGFQERTPVDAAYRKARIDDFDAETRREAVRIARSAPYDGRIPLEVSGGVDMTTLRGIAEDGVDCISIGGLTKHVHAIDFSLKLGPPPSGWRNRA